jgi:hypothetical protein
MTQAVVFERDEMDPQHIIDTCEAKWDANKSDCNHFVRAVTDALGVTIFSPGDNANAIMEKLSAAADWNLIGDRATVEADAAAGMFIIAGLKSGDFTPPRTNGHVVVVVNGDDPNHPGYPMAYWGMLGGVGQKNSSIRNSFTPNTDLPNVKYYGTALQAAMMMSLATPITSSDNLYDVKSAVESLVGTVVDALHKASDEEPKTRLFFPNGIEKIEIEVKAGPIDVRLAVVGPKST